MTKHQSSPESVLTFMQLLSETGLSKAEIGRRLGIDAATVCRWGEDAPRYALAYLSLLARVKRLCRDL